MVLLYLKSGGVENEKKHWDDYKQKHIKVHGCNKNRAQREIEL